MPLSRRRVIGLNRSLKSALFFLVIQSLGQVLASHSAHAIGEGQAMHWSAKKQVWNRKTNIHTLDGNARLEQQGELLTADHIVLDLNNRVVDATGNCIYITEDTIMYGRAMQFNLDTRTGSIEGGRISTDSFTLSGERITKLAEGRFRTIRGEYSTCKDCAQSWSFQGDDVDMTFGGYATMTNVRAKIKDVPITWIPYMLIPIKTERESGLFFPRLKFGGDDGFVFVQPFFWAISRNVDMTFGLGRYSKRGARAEWETRYILSDGSQAQANFYFQKDQSYAPRLNRWALNLSQVQELSYGFQEKLRLVDVSDNNYPIAFPGDIPNRKDSVLTSDLTFSKATPEVSTYLAARRFRNILDPDPLEFDPKTVQVLPTAFLTTNDQFLFSEVPVAAGVSFGVTNFTRTAGPFDYDVIGPTPPPGSPFRPGTDPIRKATRLGITPSLYTTLRPGDVVSIVPSAQYRYSFYSFHNAPGMPILTRAYVLTQAEMSTQFERIYDTQDPEIPKIKHLIRPKVTYSLIPYIREDTNHNFLKQIQYAQSNGYSGYNFDDYDIIPLDTSRTYNNYFDPIGNSLSYGVSTQLIRRRGKIDSSAVSYDRMVELSAGQTYNFREFTTNPQDPQPFSRFYSTLAVALDRFESYTYYYYYPYVNPDPPSNRHKVSTGIKYVLDKGLHQRVLSFERSFALGYNYDRVGGNKVKNVTGRLTYSINDYILPSFGFDYHLRTGESDGSGFQSTNLAINFQSPSQCWRITLNFNRSIERPGTNPEFDLSLNLTGQGFGGVSDVGSRVTQ